MSGILVARPKVGGRYECRICLLESEARQEVNAAIWDGTTRRAHYREAGVRTYEAITDASIDRKVITRHAEHIEQGWREASPQDPMVGREEPVFATDYESLIENAAMLTARAMTELSKRVEKGDLGDRELLGVAKMGLTARQHQRQTEVAANRPEIALLAIIGLASGHMRELPETEVIEVFDEQALKEKVQTERRLLEAGSGPERDG